MVIDYLDEFDHSDHSDQLDHLDQFDRSEPLIPIHKRNFRNVEIDAVGVGLGNAAAPFLPVFLTQLGASNFQVGLLTSMPAFTGLFLAILIGNFLQTRRKIVPWYSLARMLVIFSYALTGIVPFLVPTRHAVPAVLAIWALATIPQTVVSVAFSVVMNAVAGPKGRYDLMSRRWSILGLTTAIAVALVGLLLDHIHFPFNFQVAFMGLSIGGLISYYFSSHIVLDDNEVEPRPKGQNLWGKVREYVGLVRGQRPFISFTAMRFVFLSGSAMAAPLFPLYYVRTVHASDAWIGIITTAQTAVLMVAYFFWARQTRARGSRFVLLITTLMVSLYPAIAGLTLRVELLVVYAGLAGIFQAGIDLVFFDELMKTVPVKYSATFVSLAQSLQFLSSIIAPLVGAYLADHIGISGGLMVSAALRLTGFALFALNPLAQPAVAQPGNPSLPE